VIEIKENLENTGYDFDDLLLHVLFRQHCRDFEFHFAGIRHGPFVVGKRKGQINYRVAWFAFLEEGDSYEYERRIKKQWPTALNEFQRQLDNKEEFKPERLRYYLIDLLPEELVTKKSYMPAKSELEYVIAIHTRGARMVGQETGAESRRSNKRASRTTTTEEPRTKTKQKTKEEPRSNVNEFNWDRTSRNKKKG